MRTTAANIATTILLILLVTAAVGCDLIFDDPCGLGSELSEGPDSDPCQ